MAATGRRIEMAELSTRPHTGSNRLTGSNDLAATPRRSSFHLIAWLPKKDMEHPEWVAAGRRLGAIGRASQWWMGDWLRYGVGKWGEKYVEASKITGYDVGSLRNMASLSAQFDLSRRRDNLTWCHHAAVASLDTNEQDYWLDRAATLRLSVADLRIELRSARRSREQAAENGSDLSHESTPAHGIVCPNCGHKVSLSTHSEDETPQF
jgi:hypothetical protein